jgi:dephospho-CoA kinase
MGVPVYISDDEAKRITLTDADVRCRLTALVGSDLYSGSSMRKELLANYLFASPQNAARVNAIIHPAVKADFLRWVAAHASCPIVGIESAILIEAGFTDVVDRVVMVCAPYDVRVERAMQRDGAQRSAVERRVRAQMDDEAKLSHAHYVINNGPDSELMPQAKHLIESLKAENLK